jgi:outer membrane protein
MAIIQLIMSKKQIFTPLPFCCLILSTSIFFAKVCCAQTYSDTLLHLSDALQMAEQRLPLLKSKRLEVQASIKNTEVVKYSRVPTLDASYQANISTANNLTGQFYPYELISMTGPPSSGNYYSPATGSAASLLLNWQAVTFGMRNAQINSSIAETGVKSASLKQEIFNQKIQIISIYLDLLLAYDVVLIRLHNLERVKENLRQSIELAGSGIRPGVDSALFLSEVSNAKIELLNGKKELETEQWQLAQFVLTNALPVPADTMFLDHLPFTANGIEGNFSSHPAIQFAEKELAFNRSKEDLLKKSYLPRLTFWGTAFARGSGFEANGDVKTWDGMGLSRYNYGAGLQLSFPILKYGEVKKQLSEQSLLSQAAEQQIADTQNSLFYQQRMNTVAFKNSIVVATESEQQIKSAQYAFDAMETRYEAGLVNFADLIQAQYNLLKAELDLKKSYWDAWKGLLLKAAVNGDENIFLQQIR